MNIDTKHLNNKYINFLSKDAFDDIVICLSNSGSPTPFIRFDGFLSAFVEEEVKLPYAPLELGKFTNDSVQFLPTIVRIEVALSQEDINNENNTFEDRIQETENKLMQLKTSLALVVIPQMGTLTKAYYNYHLRQFTRDGKTKMPHYTLVFQEVMSSRHNIEYNKSAFVTNNKSVQRGKQ